MKQRSREGYPTFAIEPIGKIHSCFQEKFGIPRQAGMVPSAPAMIELFPPFHRAEMVRELDGFSHIWVQFLFHTLKESEWRPTVRPPRLGGRIRAGIFACRSPHRPNHIGISAVRLQKIEYAANGVRLHLLGGDFLNETPVIDIKPYIPYSDAIPDATEGFTTFQDVCESSIESVLFSIEAELFCANYEREHNRPLQQIIKEILSNDPRPMVQRGIKKEFAITLWEVNIRWRVEKGRGIVFCCECVE